MHQDGVNLSPIRAGAQDARIRAPAAATSLQHAVASSPTQSPGQTVRGNVEIQNMERVRQQLDNILRLQPTANTVTADVFGANARGDSFKGEGQEGLQPRFVSHTHSSMRSRFLSGCVCVCYSIATSSFLQHSGSNSILEAGGSNLEHMLAFSAKYFASSDATGATSLVSDVSTLQMENKFVKDALEKEQYRRRVSNTVFAEAHIYFALVEMLIDLLFLL